MCCYLVDMVMLLPDLSSVAFLDAAKTVTCIISLIICCIMCACT
jgi:hypothetical protein